MKLKMQTILVGISVMVLLAVCVILVATRTQAGQIAIGKLQGESLVITPSPIKLEGKLGENKSFSVMFNNTTSKQINVIGSSVTCLCVSHGDIPVSIGPGQSVEFPLAIEIKASETEENIVQVASFVTDSPGSSYRDVEIKCHILK